MKIHTQSRIIVFRRLLPLHINCPLACLLQRTCKLKDTLILQPDLGAGPIGQTTVGRGLDLEDEVVRAKVWLFELRRKEVGMRD